MLQKSTEQKRANCEGHTRNETKKHRKGKEKERENIESSYLGNLRLMWALGKIGVLEKFGIVNN
jgi:hypothetical protein